MRPKRKTIAKKEPVRQRLQVAHPVQFPSIDRELEAAAKSYYDSSLPYHNFGHVVRVLGDARKIVDRCCKANLAVDEQIVYLALLFHDAGYREDHRGKGFTSKEAYSADIASGELLGRGLHKTTVEKIKSAILSTHREAVPVTIEEKIVRAADLASIAGDYGVFYKDAVNLRKEHSLLTGAPSSVQDWRKMIRSHVEFYLSQEIHITSSPDSGLSGFHLRARANLERFLREE